MAARQARQPGGSGDTDVLGLLEADAADEDARVREYRYVYELPRRVPRAAAGGRR